MTEPTTINRMEPGAFLMDEGDTGCGYSIIPGSAVAALNIYGPLVPGWSMEWTKEAAHEIAEDESVRAVVIRIECPGGYVRGMDDMLGALRAMAATKDTYCVTSQATSGGYWSACVAKEIAATPNAMVGSIGVLGGVFLDTSKAMEAAGVTATVIGSSPLKAMGMDGVPITPEMIEAEQAVADSMAASFFADVAASRRMSVEQVKGLNARCMTGTDAKAAGLVDRVVPTCDSYVAEIAAKYPAALAVTTTIYAGRVPGTTAARAAGASTMSETINTAAPAPEANTAAQSTATAPAAQTAPVAATAKELSAAIGDPAYCFKCMEQGLTLVDAMAGYIKHVETKAPPRADPKGAAPIDTGTRTNAPAALAVSGDLQAKYFARVRAGEDPIAVGRDMFTPEQLKPVEGVKRIEVALPA